MTTNSPKLLKRRNLDKHLRNLADDTGRRTLVSEKLIEFNASKILETDPMKVLLVLLHVELEDVLSLPIDEQTKFELKMLDAYFSQKFLS